LIQLYFGKLRDKYKKTQDALKPLTLEFVKAPECNLQKLEDDIDIYERAIKAFKKKIVEYDI